MGRTLAALVLPTWPRTAVDGRTDCDHSSGLAGLDEEPPQTVFETLDLAEVVEHALTRVRRRAPGLTYAVDLEPWTVVGDAAGLERAATNLLDNAAKWSPPDGTVRVELRGGTLMVADQGPGIAPEDMPLIFDRFYRSAESRAMPGSGLGLSIVRAVAERHGGSVRAGIGDDGGAVLWLTVPGARRVSHQSFGPTSSAI